MVLFCVGFRLLLRFANNLSVERGASREKGQELIKLFHGFQNGNGRFVGTVLPRFPATAKVN
jgi:hypothetical protein